MLPHFALTLAEAQSMAAAARAEAQRNGWTMVIAIVDDGGHLILLERMDGTQKASCTVAQEKARTAVLFKRPSAAMEKVIADGRLAMLSMPLATSLEGGLPILHQGHLVGAIGVSGAQSSQDGIVAKAGLEALPQA